MAMLWLKRVDSVRDLWWIKWQWNTFSPSTLICSCQYLSTKSPYSSLFTCCFYQKDKGRGLGNFQKQCSSAKKGALDTEVLTFFNYQRVVT